MHQQTIIRVALKAFALTAFAVALASCCCGGTGDCGGEPCPAACTCFRLGAVHDCSCRGPSGPPVDTGPPVDMGPRPDTGPLPDTGPVLGTCPSDGGFDTGFDANTSDARSFDASSDASSSDDGGSSDDASDAASGDASLRPGPGAYPIPFAPEFAGGTVIALADDALSAPIPIGFSFRFFETTHTSLLISSNGFVTFATASTSAGCCFGPPIPAPDVVNDVIAYGWTDLYPPSGGSITYETRGVAPNRRFVVTVTDQPWYREQTVPRVTAQIILREGTDSIEIHTTRLGTGPVYTQGVENASGCAALFIPGRVATNFALANDGVLFVTY